MIKNLFAILTVVLSFGFSFGLHYEQPIPPSEYKELLSVGINVNWATFGWLERDYWKYRSEGIYIPYYFAERGFNTVRIRIRDLPPDTELKKLGITYGEYVKTVIKDSLDAGLIPVVSLGAKRFLQNPSEKTLEYTVEVWREWAETLKGLPYEVSYDLITETAGALKNRYDLLNEFYGRVLKVIREIDPNRIVFLTPPGTSQPYYLKYLKLPKNDRYVMVEWHFFAGGPSPRNPRKKWTTGTPEERENILHQIRYAKEWCTSHHVYCWVGAWMPSNWNRVNRKAKYPDGSPAGGNYDRDEIYNFARFMAKSLKDNDIPYAINADTKFFDYKNLRWYSSLQNILDVILHPY